MDAVAGIKMSGQGKLVGLASSSGHDIEQLAYLRRFDHDMAAFRRDHPHRSAPQLAGSSSDNPAM
jgi:hypothetical protein